MKKHLTHHWETFRSLPQATQYAWMILTTLLLVWIVINTPVQNTLPVSPSNHNEAQTLNLPTQTVGSESEAFATVASWGGEVISQNDADIQPPRAGTIIAWDVSIGERVTAGQVLGRLSSAPLTPELAKTLADQSEALSRARANVLFAQTYSEQSKTQIAQFTTSNTTENAIEDAKAVVRSNVESMRSALQQAISREFPEFSMSGGDTFTLHKQNRLSTVNLKSGFGVLNSGLREQYLRSLDEALRTFDGQVLPEIEGKQYFLDATRLVSASIADQNYTQEQLTSLKRNIGEDQASFNATVEKYHTALLDVSEKQKVLAEQMRNTASSITTLDKERSTAETDFIAAEAAYRAVASAINGGTVIVAPKSGSISAITKQVGEFVAPGISVASVSSGIQTDKMVRFRIPSNVEVPKKGDLVRIVRPGFAKDVRLGRVIGVGAALDGNGAFMADARFESSVEWPAHLSVRVIPEKHIGQSVAVPFNAVWWDEENHPHVWLVSDELIISERPVVTGRTYGDAVEILSGLTIGDTYITEPTDHIKDGMKLNSASIPKTTDGASTSGDGHGHSHDE